MVTGTENQRRGWDMEIIWDELCYSELIKNALHCTADFFGRLLTLTSTQVLPFYSFIFITKSIALLSRSSGRSTWSSSSPTPWRTVGLWSLSRTGILTTALWRNTGRGSARSTGRLSSPWSSTSSSTLQCWCLWSTQVLSMNYFKLNNLYQYLNYKETRYSRDMICLVRPLVRGQRRMFPMRMLSCCSVLSSLSSSSPPAWNLWSSWSTNIRLVLSQILSSWYN